MKKIIIVLMISCALLFAGFECAFAHEFIYGDQYNKTFFFGTDTPNQSAIKINNASTSDVTLRLDFNNSLVESDYDLLNKILLLEPECEGEPLQRKAWRFVRDTNSLGSPLTAESWGHSPSLFLNSIGFGYCDDTASVYAHIMRLFGYNARVYFLNGHLVPEVYADNRWEMYDCTLGVYYYNQQGQVASVAELESTPSLVTNPINSVTTDTWPYSQSVADLYSTTADNFVATAYELNPLKDYKFTVTMPENSTFEFPGIYASPLKTCYSNITSGYTNARLTIPANYTGKVEIPLVLHTITGTGKVLLNNEEVDIGSAEMTSKINQRDNFIDVEFIGNNNAVQIIYLLNPRIVKMNYCNVLSLTGSNLSGISAKLITLQ